MKLSYEYTQLFLEILNEANQKYQKDIDDVCTESGAIKFEIPTDVGTHMLAKLNFTEWLIKEIQRGTVEF